MSSWNRDTIPGFQNPAGKFIRHALALAGAAWVVVGVWGAMAIVAAIVLFIVVRASPTKFQVERGVRI